MLKLERTIQERFPQWFDGVRAPFSRALLRSFSRLSRLKEIEGFLGRSGHLRGLAFVEAALEFVQCRYLVDQIERERIPEQGRVVIAANHPMGGIDALVLLALVGSVRRDVKILANDMLMSLDGLADLVIPIRLLGGKPSPENLRLIQQSLQREEALIVFPAGEVSRFTLRGVRDAQWRASFVRIAEQAAAPILPVRIEGRNSALFYGVSAACKPLGTPLLPRELFARSGSRVIVRVAAPRRVEEFAAGDRRRASVQVRQAVYAIGRREENTWTPALAPIVHRPCATRLRRELDHLPLLGETSDGKRIHAGRLATDSTLMREIARLREITFRQVGEGTGKRFDTDIYDSWYDHIVLWDAQQQEVAGAYRAVHGARALAERGLAGLYTASLFEFDAKLVPMIEQGVELGRSFVSPAYWGTRSLDYLWFGIGAWLREHPEVRYLFGPVSISAALPAPARDLMVGYFSRYFGQHDSPARSANPFRYHGGAPDFGDLDADAAMQVLRTQLDALGARIPVLYKQYLELCEPGGASFLAFGVDPDFGNSVDGLIRVDLQRIKRRKFERYIAPRLPARA
jgi:putative hemolysin